MTNVFGKVTLGSDPEIFVTKEDGTPWGALTTGCKGTKEAPLKAGNGAIQVDGLALEFNIAPAESVDEWLQNHDEMMKIVAKTAADNNLIINNQSRLDFNTYIDTQKPTEDELLFGCDPDFNADTMKENTMPDNDGSIKFRTTGGHVHIGLENWGELHGGVEEIKHMMASKVIQVMDLMLGVPSILIDDGRARKELYGKAGAYRIKPYGVEYRTLSNFWVFDEQVMAGIFDAVQFGIRNFEELSKFAELNREEIVKSINEDNSVLAEEILAKLEQLIKEKGIE